MRWRQWSKAQNWPMTTERRVRMPQVVVGDVGQPLDLAHHVVAEIPDQPRVQWRQTGQRRRLEARHHVLHRGQNAPVGVGQAQTAGGHDMAAARGERGQGRRPTNE